MHVWNEKEDLDRIYPTSLLNIFWCLIHDNSFPKLPLQLGYNQTLKSKGPNNWYTVAIQDKLFVNNKIYQFLIQG